MKKHVILSAFDEGSAAACCRSGLPQLAAAVSSHQPGSKLPGGTEISGSKLPHSKVRENRCADVVHPVTLIDSPVANVANIARALRAAGASVELTSDPLSVLSATKVVLPGVGSFVAAMEWLRATRIDDALHAIALRGTPLLGICVGHQVLFDSSDEMTTTAGLGLLRGRVSRLATSLPVPQIGWNRVQCNAAALFDGVDPDTPFYFVNSFVAAGVPDEIASADYGTPFTAAVQKDNVYGVQFHPEKSSGPGLRVLRNFVWM